MSVSDTWGDYDSPCPHCGGTVHYWYFAPDCRGNPGGLGVHCKACEKDFSSAPTGLADQPCKKCGGEVEYQFTLPGPFGDAQRPSSRMFCRRCGEEVTKKRREPPAPTKPKRKPTMCWTSPKRR